MDVEEDQRIMKTMLKLKSVLLLAGAAVLAAGLSGCSDENVGSVSLGILTLKDNLFRVVFQITGDHNLSEEIV